MDMAELFMRGLQQIERDREPTPLAELFSEEAELINAVKGSADRGREGARRFWYDYLRAFDDVRSEFSRVLRGDNFAALEWNSDATLPGGRRMNYAGISLVEFDGP